MAKKQRDHERISPRNVEKIHTLYRKHYVEIALIAERFGIDEDAVKDVLSRPYAPPDKRLRVKWDDAEGVRREELFETFRAAKMFLSRLNAEWSRIEPA